MAGRFKICLIAVYICVFLPALSCLAVTTFEIYEASALNQVIKRNTLIVGMEVKFFPFEYTDTDGRPIGFDVDLAKLAAQELGVRIEIKDMEFSGLIPALQAWQDRHDNFRNDTDAGARKNCIVHAAIL